MTASKWIALAASVALAGCATQPLTLNDDVIVGGERVGDIEIGMALSDLLAVKGTPQQTIPMQGSAATTYIYDGVSVGAHDTVYWIIVTDPRFRTLDGVSVGAEQIFARGRFGQPQCVVSRAKDTLYDYGDLYFDVDNLTGKVVQIGVQAETTNCDG